MPSPSSGPQTPPTPPTTAGALLRRAIRRRRGRVACSLALMTMWQVCEAFVPVAIGIIVDVAIVPLDGTAMLLSLLGIGVLFTVLSLGYRFGARLANTAQQREAHDLRVEVAEVPLASGAVAARSNAGEILSLSSADADVTAMVFRQIAAGGSAVIGIVAVSVYLLLTDVGVGLVVLLGVPLSLLLVALPARSISKHSTAQQDAVGLASRRAGDILAGLRVLSAGGGERWAGAHYREASQRAAGAGVVTAERSGRLEAIGALGTAVVLALVLLVAGQRVLAGELSLGALVSVVGVAVFFQEPVHSITATVGTFARSHGAARRIADFLGAVPAEPAGERVPESAGLRVNGLALALAPDTVPDAGPRPPRDAHLDLEVPPGRFTALVVDDPAHAETVLDALAGLGEQADAVRIGGSPRRQLVPRLARYLVVAPHRVDLFAGTVRSNIVLHHGVPGEASGGASGGVPGSVAGHPVDPRVLDAAGVTEIVEHLPGGLDHRVDEGGRNLSGGQRQRIALARALHADPAVLVLHEPTSAVDAVTEVQIARGVLALRSRAGSGRTTVVVTSSPAFLAVADSVVHVRRDGTSTVGTHHTLSADSADYRQAVDR